MNRLVYIVDSHQRLDEKDSHSNFSFSIQLPIMPTASAAGLAVCVLRACIPRSYYLINQTYGNTFTLQEDAKTAVVTIPYGNYTASNFITTLLPLLNAASPNARIYAISFSTLTGKFTYTVTCGHIKLYFRS